jgi:hypothetical protein
MFHDIPHDMVDDMTRYRWTTWSTTSSGIQALAVHLVARRSQVKPIVLLKYGEGVLRELGPVSKTVSLELFWVGCFSRLMIGRAVRGSHLWRVWLVASKQHGLEVQNTATESRSVAVCFQAGQLVTTCSSQRHALREGKQLADRALLDPVVAVV